MFFRCVGRLVDCLVCRCVIQEGDQIFLSESSARVFSTVLLFENSQMPRSAQLKDDQKQIVDFTENYQQTGQGKLVNL